MKAAVLLLFIIPYIYAQTDCSAYSANCTSCAAQGECGWCSATQQCLEGTANGPKTGYCLGQSWHFGVTTCPRCDLMTDCRQCNLHPAECGWCQDTKECQPLSYFRGGLGRCKKVDFCPCDIYSSCDSCLDGSNCQWCGEEERCKTRDQECTGPAFNTSVGCPCRYNRDCSSCKGAYNCKWCNDLGVCKEKSDTGPCLTPTGQSCSAYCGSYGNQSCAVCNDLNGCAWCTPSKSCVDQRYGECNMIAHTCEECSKHKYCDPCKDVPGCIWCASDRTCRPKSEASNGCMAATSCLSYCNGIPTCNQCNEAPGCGWCATSDGMGKCLDVDSPNSCSAGMWAHACQVVPVGPSGKCGFDGGSFVGGMFLVIGLIVVGGAAYLFYRWKTGRKILYTELR